MDLQFDEQLNLWQAVHVEQRGATDKKYTELDRHFAQVTSWRDELSEPELDGQQLVMPEVGEREAANRNGRSTKPLYRLNDTAAVAIRAGAVEIEPTPLEVRRERYLQSAAAQAAKQKELRALEQVIKGREDELEAALQFVVKQRRELEHIRLALEDKERELHAEHEQWGRDAAQREQSLDSREHSLDNQQKSLDAQRDRLEEKAIELEREVSCLEEARACFHQQQAPPDLERSPAEEEVSSAQSDTQSDTQSATLSAVVHDELTQPVDTVLPLPSPRAESAAGEEDDLCGLPDDETQEDDPSSCFEHVSLEQMSDEDEQFDELIDRLVQFHVAKSAKWYKFWG